jgi:hypothetical protein
MSLATSTARTTPGTKKNLFLVGYAQQEDAAHMVVLVCIFKCHRGGTFVDRSVTRLECLGRTVRPDGGGKNVIKGQEGTIQYFVDLNMK